MAKHLPNYYIILRIQPNATAETIKASYRKLMVTLKMHPDLGGDHEVAAQINEAYAVLKDSAKRAKYDRMYLLQRLEAAQAAARERHRASSTDSRSSAGPAKHEASAAQGQDDKRRRCPFCDASLAQRQVAQSRCERCRSPLGLPPAAGSFGRELFGRRAAPRIPKSHFATIHPKGQTRFMTVKMRDLSLTGLSFYVEYPLDVDQVFKFRDATLEAVAVVVSRSKRGEWHSVYARLLTVAFHQAGVFVSASS